MAYVFILLAMVMLRLCLPRDGERERRIFATACCFMLVCVAALRAPTVGRDTQLFLDVFDKLHGRSLPDVLTFPMWVEPGFRVLCWLIGLFTANGQWLIVLTSVFINVSVSDFIYRHAKNVYLGFFLYLTMMQYTLYLNVMRQALAIAIILFAWGFFKKRRYVPYILLVLLAATFHTSALLFLLCPLLCLVPVTRRTLRVILPLTLILALTGALLVRPILRVVTSLLPRYSDYEATSFDALYCFLAVFLVITGVGIWRLYFSKDAMERSMPRGSFDEVGFLTLMMLTGVVVAAMMTQFGQLQRVFYYFEMLYLLWLPEAVPAAFFEERKQHIAFPVLLIATLAFATAYFLVILFLRSALWYDALPYRFFWQ